MFPTAEYKKCFLTFFLLTTFVERGSLFYIFVIIRFD
jgi:hypothetical protein